jgi:hypothetical protein
MDGVTIARVPWCEVRKADIRGNMLKAMRLQDGRTILEGTADKFEDWFVVAPWLTK